MAHSELTWNQDGKKLYAQAWTVENPKAVLAIVHGFAEYGGRYAAAAGFFNQKGLSVIAIDQFGHGKSEGPRGHSPSYNATMDSVENLLVEAQKLAPNKPLFLWGHSMGGNVVLNYLLRRKPDIAGAIATAPWLKLGFEPPKFKIMLAKVMRNIFPAFPEKANLDTNMLSRDKAVVKAYDEDPLVHNQATAGTFFETYDAGYWAIEHAASLSNYLLIMHGTKDQLISPEGSAEFFENTNQTLATYKTWEGYFHELHNEPEPDRTKVLTEMMVWMEGRLTPTA